jgi:excisionase family DNA binding protein
MLELPKRKLLRPDEVATYFGVSRTSVYTWIDHGMLVAEQYGRILRIRRDSVIRLQEISQRRSEVQYGEAG